MLRSPGPSVRLAAAAVALSLLGATACSTTDARRAAATPSSSSRVDAPFTAAAISPAPCGAATAPPTRFKHVVWIWMENHSTAQLLGPKGSAAARRAPYENALARACGVATGYRAITHPSLPNYLAATSGSTHGIARTCRPADCSVGGQSLFGQVTATGRHWRTYSESMPHACTRTDSGRYVPRHNPAVYYTALRAACAKRDVPFAATRSNRLVRDAANDNLPAFTFVQPDQCHNTHDCSIGTGDAWLARVLPSVLGSKDYRAGSTAVVLVWDEGYGGTAGTDCSRSTSTSCRMPMIVIARSVPKGTRVGGPADHYALLRTTEAMLGIKAHLGRASSARDLRRAFGLR